MPHHFFFFSNGRIGNITHNNKLTTENPIHISIVQFLDKNIKDKKEEGKTPTPEPIRELTRSTNW